MLVKNKEKYKSVILYLCEKLGGTLEGKKKLAKLLYFADFDMFEYMESMKTITGDNYKALQMGPVPNLFVNMIEELTKEGALEKTERVIGNGYSPLEVFKSTKKPDYQMFSEEEKYILDRVVSKYGKLNGKQLEDLTHGEAPWNGVKFGETIPFELAFYRDTEFA